MVENFFSTEYAGRGDLFEGLYIWKEEAYRTMQGTWPVLSLSFAKVKEATDSLNALSNYLMRYYRRSVKRRHSSNKNR